MKKWSDKSILKKLSFSDCRSQQITINCAEFTFFGVKNQPDYTKKFRLLIYPDKYVIELKSWKLYIQQFRNKIIGYERIIDVVYGDLMKVYKFRRLRIEMEFNPRGGISSEHVLDSDWEVLGGEGRYWREEFPNDRPVERLEE